jgi:hypothetical protein
VIKQKKKLKKKLQSNDQVTAVLCVIKQQLVSFLGEDVVKGLAMGLEFVVQYIKDSMAKWGNNKDATSKKNSWSEHSMEKWGNNKDATSKKKSWSDHSMEKWGNK